jgi:hypothetical protein
VVSEPESIVHTRLPTPIVKRPLTERRDGGGVVTTKQAAKPSAWSFDAPAAPAYSPPARKSASGKPARSQSPIRGAGDRRRAMMAQMTAPQR